VGEEIKDKQMKKMVNFLKKNLERGRYCSRRGGRLSRDLLDIREYVSRKEEEKRENSGVSNTVTRAEKRWDLG